MEILYAPWRMTYLQSEKPPGCIFCRNAGMKTDLILYQGKTAFVMMNRYPYVSGHLMVIPCRHTGMLEDLSTDEKGEMFALVSESVTILKKEIKPEGFNIGMNVGKAAGAGVEDHLHIHIVPRWIGDTNFMSMVGDIRVIPEDLHKLLKQLQPHYDSL